MVRAPSGDYLGQPWTPPLKGALQSNNTPNSASSLILMFEIFLWLYIYTSIKDDIYKQSSQLDFRTDDVRQDLASHHLGEKAESQLPMA